MANGRIVNAFQGKCQHQGNQKDEILLQPKG